MALAVDEQAAYWTSGTSSAHLIAYSHAGASGSVTAAGFVWPRDLALGPDHVFVATAGGVLSVPRGGGRSISYGDAGAYRLALDHDAVFALERTGSIYRISLDGSGRQQIGNAGWACGLALGESHVYVTNDVAGTVSSLPKAGGGQAAVVLATGQRGACDIAVDSQALYWTTEAAVVRLAKSGGSAPRVIARSPGGAAGIVLDAAAVYWIQGSSLMRVSKAAGRQAEVILSGAAPQDLALHDGMLYWPDIERRAIMRMAASR